MASFVTRTTSRGERTDVRYRTPDGVTRTRTFRSRRAAEQFVTVIETDKDDALTRQELVAWAKALPPWKPPPEDKCTTHVYFIQAGPAGPIKIGHSINPQKRLSQLQVSHAEPLKLLGSVRADDSTEVNLHARFQHSYMRGEWFRPTADLLAFIVWNTGGAEASITSLDEFCS